MTAPTDAVLVFSWMMGLVWIWLALHGWKVYFLDDFRQELFAIRDELFDLAASKQVDFDDEAYWRLRKSINALIRFAHKVCLTRTILPNLLEPLMSHHDEAPPFSYQRWQTAVQRLDHPETRAKIQKLEGRVAHAAIRQLIRSSPISFLVLFIIAILVAGPHALKAIRSSLEERARVIEREAELDAQLATT